GLQLAGRHPGRVRVCPHIERTFMRCSTPRAHLIRRLSAAGVALAATAVPLAAAAPHASAGTSAVSLWARTSRPAATWHFHTGVELGVRFTPAVRGKITAIRYYRVARDTGAHVGHLWNRNGRLLAAVTFRHQSRTGWQVARLSKPVPVAAHST